jgi:acyl-homoserine-lactone acylase
LIVTQFIKYDMRRSFLLLMIFLFAAASLPAQARKPAELWRQVEIIRTSHGVPHIRAESLRAAGYALAWLQCEDYGPNATPMELLEASGRRAVVGGYSQIETDFLVLRHREKMVASYPKLSKDVRDVYEGFAAGVNRYIELHRDQFPAGMPMDFTGADALVTELVPPPTRKIRLLINRVSPSAPPVGQQSQTGEEEGEIDPNEGSNAWAFAPNRTKSGKAILLRNPHLQWSAGYYEAHVTVPGVVDFYGDFRIGGPFTVIGGFSKYLGWSTTNNSPDLDEFYELDVDPKQANHYIFDGRSVALERKLITATFRNGEGMSTETREFWSTPIGPVIHRANGKIYVVKYVGDGEYRAGEQFLKMMRAKSLTEWQTAMKMRARITSNFTYADHDGNIYFLWNASLPLLPHPVGEDLVPKPAHKMADVWTQFVPFEKLPQFLNPAGGYTHNENNSPHFTNIAKGVDLKNAYPNFEEPELSLRAQLALQLVSGSEKLSLEDVIRLKHNYRMLLPDRVKSDLIAAVKATNPTGDVATAIALLEKWDNTAAPDNRGSVIFELWWQIYSVQQPAGAVSSGQPNPVGSRYPDEKRFASVWNSEDPFNTPRGLADPARAVQSFTWAVAEAKRRYGSFDVTWGDVHRVRRGPVDVPVGGCSNDLGCFRILGFTRTDDGKLAANSGDGWILAVEFTDTPRAYSVLAYGESPRRDSPWFSDQAEMFAKGELKPVAFTEKDINADMVRRYRPGEKANGDLFHFRGTYSFE